MKLLEMGMLSGPEAKDVHVVIENMPDAFLTGDLDRFMSFFADDVVVMPPGAPAVVGIEGFKNMMTEMFSRSERSDGVSISRDITVVEDWAIEWHEQATTYTSNETGKSTRQFHKGIWVFRREDGNWKIARYCWNNAPEVEPV
jgi:uncharacterized protein (TIGR02246 family)